MLQPDPVPSALFDGLDAGGRAELLAVMRERRFAAEQYLCREGEPGDSLFVIRSGLAQVVVEGGRVPSLARLRRGDVVGEMALVTGEARSASVVARVPTEALELRRDAFASVLARHPAILGNISRILSRRLARTNAQRRARHRGEAVALVAGDPGEAWRSDALRAARAASPRPVAVVDLARVPVDAALAALDDQLATHGTVVLVAGASLDPQARRLLVTHVDRTVAVAREGELAGLAPLGDGAAARLQLVLLGASSPLPGSAGGWPILRGLDPARPRDAAWLGRHLTRTKIGLALGAGGAKGFAHVGALRVLEEAGYTVDCAGGTSAGAQVAAWTAMGRSASEAEAGMRRFYSPENVAALFQLSLSGLSKGADLHRRLCHEMSGERTFGDLVMPFVAMGVDLAARRAAPLREGPVWEALVASTAVAGLFPAVERDEQKLVDGVALVPVPTDAVEQMGADVVVAVNVMSRDVLPAWPDDVPVAEPPPAPARRRGAGMLETLLEVMDLAQLDASERHAARADVVVTPRFGPATWRDFHLADAFMAAGAAAARAQLPALHALVRPPRAGTDEDPELPRRTGGADEQHPAVHVRAPQGDPGDPGRVAGGPDPRRP